MFRFVSNITIPNAWFSTYLWWSTTKKNMEDEWRNRTIEFDPGRQEEASSMNEVRTTQKLTNKEKRGKFLMKIGEAREFDESYGKGKRMSPLGLFRGHSLGLCTPAAVENALPFSLPSSFSLSLSLNINTYSFPYRTAPMGKLKPSPPSSRDPSCL